MCVYVCRGEAGQLGVLAYWGSGGAATTPDLVL